MKSTNRAVNHTMRGVGILFLLVAMTVFAFSQDLILSRDITNNGTINVNRNVVNNSGGGNTAVLVDGTGIVVVKGAASATTHQIKSNGTAGITFAKLDILGARTTTLKIATTVRDALRIGDGTTGYTSTFDIESNTFGIGGTSTFDNTHSTATVTFSAGTVAYTNAGPTQTLLDKSALGGLAYGILNLSGNANYTVPASAAQTAATLSHTGSGTVTFNESMDVATSASIGSLANIAATKVLQFTTTATGTITSMNNGSTGILRKAGTAGTVTVTTLAGNLGTIELTGAGAFSFTNAAVNGNIIQATAPSTGMITFANNLSGAGSLTLAGSSMVQYAGTVAQGGGFSYASGSTARFNGAVDQSVPGTTYYTLDLVNSNIKSLGASTDIRTALTASSGSPAVTIAGATTLNTGATADIKGNLTVDAALTTTGAGTVTLSGAGQSIGGTQPSVTFNGLTLAGSAAKSSSLDIAVNGTFTPTSGIDMATADKTLYAKGTVGAYGALQEVKGKMKRDVSGTGVAIKMNNDITDVTFAVAAPSDFTLDLRPATSPTGGNLVFDVNRKATMSYTAWGVTGSATLKLAYRYGERPSGGGNEAKTRYYDVTDGAKTATGYAVTRLASSAADAANSDMGYVSLAGINPTGSGTTIARSIIALNSEIKMTGASFPFVTIANAQPFTTAGTWDEDVVPTASDDAQISHTGITVPLNAFAATLTIDASKDITVGGADLTATTINDAGAVAVSATRTLTATTYNKTVGSSTFTGKAALTSLHMTGGSLAFNGTAGDASTIQNAVTLDNGSSISVGGSLSAVTASAGDFTLNNTASLTLPNASSVLNVGVTTIASNLKLNGTSTVTVTNAAGTLSIFGNLEIGATAGLTNNGIINVGE